MTASLALGLFYQFFLHTDAVPPLGWLEGKLLNTPSAHRVHHGSNSVYIDRNYAGALIVWDRLFGTYQAEVEPVRILRPASRDTIRGRRRYLPLPPHDEGRALGDGRRHERR